MNHQHRFEEPNNVEVDESLVIYQDCRYREIRGEHYSERYDEVFYDEGPKCDATKITYYELDGLFYDLANTDDPQTGLMRIEIEDDRRLVEDLLIRAEREVSEQVQTQPDPVEFDPAQDEILWCMNHEGDEYVVRWERSDQEVLW